MTKFENSVIFVDYSKKMKKEIDFDILENEILLFLKESKAFEVQYATIVRSYDRLLGGITS